MNRYIQQVKEFHENFGHPVDNYNNEIPMSTRKLRIKLIFEELEELSEASDLKLYFNTLCQKTIDKNESVELEDGENVNKTEELDAFGDLQYVLSGGILAHGYQDIFDVAFDAIHASNMSKACETLEHANDTIEYYKTREKDAAECYYEYKNGLYFMYRQGDNKVMKNIHYTEANVGRFLKFI